MDATENLRKTADTLLKQQFGPESPPSPAEIDAAIEKASQALASIIPDCASPTVKASVRAILIGNWNVYEEDSRILDASSNDHREWLTQSAGLVDPARSEISWKLWSRYRKYLDTEKGRPEAVLRALDKSTTEVLRRLEDPARPGAWDRRGMVVGSVQSGKTGNYAGLACKAIDAGYKLVIVLAGMHENLRRQTQVRLDEELRGRQTRDVLNSEAQIGVGKVDPSIAVRSVTTSAVDMGNGDFSKQIAERRGLLELGSDPTYMVVKKNTHILKNINRWLKSLPEFRGDKVRGVPLLVIDDECDQASINTRDIDPDDEEQDMTAINKRVRELLSRFEQSAYIGYTATPFANIFIPPDSRDINVEEDLFPRDFIVNLEPPSNYVGATQLFGLRGVPDDEIEEQAGLPLIRPIKDHWGAFPPGHKKDHDPGCLPGSLSEALMAFMLACAVRWQRGQVRQHNSMLVHVSRFNLVQEKVENLVTEEYDRLKNRIEMNDGKPHDTDSPVLQEFRKLWERDFVTTSGSTPGSYSQPPWDELVSHLRDVAPRIQVATVNGLAKQALTYDTEAAPINVIAIGGDKFSRGFTLEGLTVSYYLRATNMYDTLMQMGRWFGYRDGYLDVCRIYTTPSLRDSYQFIAGAIEELRRDFRRMTREGARPIDFGHKVRLHPGSALLVTSRTKSRKALKMRMSLDGRLAQTLVFPLQQARNNRNFVLAREFLDELAESAGPPVEAGGIRKWEDVPGERILRFVDEFYVHQMNSFEVAQLLKEYIEDRIRHDELTHWTVAFDTSPRSNGAPLSLAGTDFRTIVRESGHKIEEEGNAVRIKVLTTPRHELIDLDEHQRQRALALSIQEFQEDRTKLEGRRRKGESEPRTPYPDLIRKERKPTHGLLVLYFVDPEASWERSLDHPATGFGVSFPGSSDSDCGIEYLANQVYQWEAGLD